jgi:hypothetical protein
LSHRRVLTLLATPLALGAGLIACGTDPPDATSTTADTFVLDEWSVTPPAPPITAGTVKITATNRGNETHELVIVQAAEAAPLPTTADGSVDEDKIPEEMKAGEIADLAPGKTANTTLVLPAGRYVAFCNLVDDIGQGPKGSGGMGTGSGMGGRSGMGTGTGMHHVHYQLGMLTAFTVT